MPTIGTRTLVRGAPIALAFLGAALAATGCGKSGGQTASAAPVAPTAPAQPAAMVSVSVPLTGCANDGQGGPEATPASGSKTVTVEASAAPQLAYYVAADGPGVLGPRGWHCASIYGSDGATLVLSPDPLSPGDVGAMQTSADAIEARVASGDTSGRFTVAKVIARVFPSRQAFAQGVINEGIEPASDFPSGPYPSDRMTPKGDNVAEFASPAGAVGLGTDVNLNERLKPGADPVSGVVILSGDAPDLVEVTARLPANLRPLAASIVAQFERDAAGPPANQTAAEVTQDFYLALGRGDGATASGDVAPEKRSGNYSAAALTKFYGAMAQPLALQSVNVEGSTVEVHYTYTTANGRACNGAADVSTTSRGGVQLISGIKALNGC